MVSGLMICRKIMGRGRVGDVAIRILQVDGEGG